MKKQGLPISCAIIYLVLIMAVMVFFAKQAQAQPSSTPKKITLKIIYEQPITDRGHSLFKVWQEKVNAVAPQRLHIQYLGGYEVIPTFQQMEALRKGTVDMAVLAPTFYTGVLSEGMAIQLLGAKATVPETRKNGMVALQDQIHRAKLGVAFLGSLWAGDRHIIYLKKSVDKADLKGFKIRGIAVHHPAVRVLGGTIVTIPIEEVYTALQAGLLDGACTPTVLAPDYRYEEVTNYMFFPLIPASVWVPLLVRAEVWDGLPEDIKKIIMTPLLEMEHQVDAYFGEIEKGIIDKSIAKGLKKCGPTSPIEIEETTKKMIKAQWKTFVEDRADPAWLPKLNAIAKPVLGLD